MDWETLYCPNRNCRYYGLPFRQGKMVKNGSSYGQPKALCKGCWSNVALSYATAYYGLESEPTIFEMAVRALAEGNSILATGRILQIDKDTVGLKGEIRAQVAGDQRAERHVGQQAPQQGTRG